MPPKALGKLRLSFWLPRIIDLPLHTDKTARFVPWMVGLMLYVALLFGMTSVVLFQGTHHALTYDTPQLTLEIPYTPEQQEAALQPVLHALNETGNVERIHLVTPEEVRQSFVDFLHEPLPTIDETPYEPLLVDVWLHQRQLSALQTLKQHLLQRIPELGIKIHRSWTQPLLAWAHWMKWGLLAIAVLLTAGLGVVVAFVTYTGLSIHKPVVDVLDLMGASTRYITRQFQLQTRRNTLKSTAIAFGFLAFSLGAMAFFLDSVGQLAFFLTPGILEAQALFILLFTIAVILLMRAVTWWVVKRALSTAVPC